MLDRHCRAVGHAAKLDCPGRSRTALTVLGTPHSLNRLRWRSRASARPQRSRLRLSLRCCATVPQTLCWHRTPAAARRWLTCCPSVSGACCCYSFSGCHLLHAGVTSGAAARPVPPLLACSVAAVTPVCAGCAVQPLVLPLPMRDSAPFRCATRCSCQPLPCAVPTRRSATAEGGGAAAGRRTRQAQAAAGAGAGAHPRAHRPGASSCCSVKQRWFGCAFVCGAGAVATPMKLTDQVRAVDAS